MSVNVKLGNNTINGVDVVKLENADSAGNYIEFSPVVNPVAEENDVEFIDYDGTIRYSYTASEFANLTALPPNPTHEGLTAQGWNWTLVNAKTYVNLTGNIIIGQMYVTDDNTTRIYIDLEEGRLSPILGICPNGTATINWGDGSATSRLTGTSTSTLKTANHTYSAAGEYKITISMSANGTLGIGLGGSPSTWGSKLISLNRNTSSSSYYYNSSSSSSNSYVNDIYISCMKHIELGSNVTLGEYALSHTGGLKSIVISKGITSIPNSCFYPAHTLESIVIPNTVTSLGQYVFYGCNSLHSVSIPNSVTSIGTDAVRQCASLQRYLPPDNATLSLHTSGTETNFQSTYNLRYLHLPHTMTSLSGFTNGNLIGGMRCLSSITIPSNVTTLNAGFYGAVGMGYIKFEPTTPPTAPTSTGFNMLPLDCKIYVPSASLSAYKTATNYPPSGKFTYIGY